MWIKENGTWVRANNILSSDEFKPTLNRLQTYAKCLNAASYSVTNQLNDIYSIIHYQHGFYVELLTNAPQQIIVSGITIIKGQLYNLSLYLTHDVIVSNALDYQVVTEDDGTLSMSIRTAIALGYIKAANSLLFTDTCGFDYWNSYIAPNLYVTTGGACWQSIVETVPMPGGTDGTNGTSGTIIEFEPLKNIILSATYTEADVYSVFNDNEENLGWSLSTVWTPDKLLNKLLSNFRLVDAASVSNIDLITEWFELIIDGIRVNDQMQILLKNQTNPAENGVYQLINRFLHRSTILDEIKELDYFSVYVKGGTVNNEKQFFLDRLPNGEYPMTDFGTSGAALTFSEGFNWAIRNRIDYNLLQNNTIRDSAFLEEHTPILYAYESFNYSYDLNGKNYRISAGGNFIEIKDITTGDILLVGLVDNSTASDLTAVRLNALNIFRKTTGDKFIFINIENNVPIAYQFDPSTYVSTAIFSIPGLYDFSICENIGYGLVDISTPTTKLSRIIVVNINVPLVTNQFDFDFFILELQVFDNTLTGEVFYFFNTSTDVYIFNENIGKTVLRSGSSKYLTLSKNCLETDSSTAGTAGTSGQLDTELFISWIDQVELRPVRYKKNISTIGDYADWNAFAYLEGGTNGITSEFIIKSGFSKTVAGDWKIANNTLYLKDVNILSGTNGLSVIPKISNTIGRYFDGVNDFAQFTQLDFTGVTNFSIEFSVIPDFIINNNRAFYFATQIINNQYNSVEFILLDINTGFPKFQFKYGNSFITVDCNTQLTNNILTRITITMEMSSTQNNQYAYTARVWFNNTVVGTSTGAFNAAISQLGALTSCYLAKTDSVLDPKYRGEIREFRISNIVLNPAEIASRDRAIIPSDLTYPALLYYWNLQDKTSIIHDQIGHLDGVFNGGLAQDPDLALIGVPKQMLFSQDGQYLYLWASIATQYPVFGTSGTAGTSGTSGESFVTFYNDSIFQIEIRTENLNLLYNTANPITSIYVENNLLYWLEENKIWQYQDSGNLLEVTINNLLISQIFDFVVVNDFIFYISTDNRIFDQLSQDVTGLNTIPNPSQITWVYGLYQSYNSIFWYNVYFALNDGTIKIISSPFTSFENIIGNTFENIAIYPFYPSISTFKKSIIAFGQKFAITSSNQVVSVANDLSSYIDLDPTQKYWSYQSSSIFGISMPTFDLLYIGSINESNQVNIWRYNTVTGQIVLMQYDDNNSLFTAVQDLDLIVTSDISGKILTIIEPNYSTFRRFIIEDIYLRLTTLEVDIDLNLIGVLKQLQSIDINNFYYTIQRAQNLWVGRAIRFTNSTYWIDDMKFTYRSHKLWVCDFGVAFRENSNTDPTQHTLDLLPTLVKWDFTSIKLNINYGINENNFVNPIWNGVAYITGTTGGILKTVDFGNTWHAISVDIPSNLNAISLLDGAAALVVGQNSTILQTFSAGQFFDTINVDPNLTFEREFTDVLIYNSNNAIVVGKGGLILHLVLNEITNTWSISNNILNNQTLVTVTASDLESRIKPQVTQNSEVDVLLTNYTKIIQSGDSEFWLFGDRGLITNMVLTFSNNQILPKFIFYQTNFNFNTIDAVSFLDYQDGLKKFLFATSNNLYTFTEQGAIITTDSNLRNVTVTPISSNINYSITDINYEYNYNDTPVRYENIYVSGTLNNIKQSKFQFQDTNNLIYGIVRPLNFSAVDNILNEYFKPRLLFTDYYLARKINILLDADTWIVPTVNVDKGIFNCYKFLPGESIEFAAHNSSNNANYLAIQDWYYTTRRIMLTDANGATRDGEVKSYPYNKVLTAVADMTNYIVDVNSGNFFTTGPIIQNVDYYNSPTFSVNFPEQYVHTTIKAPSNFIVNSSDVINVTIKRDAIDSNNLPYTQILMDEVFIVKHVEPVNAGNQTIVLWDLLDTEILADTQFGLSTSASTAGYSGWNIELRNLNYFISDAAPDVQPLLALKNTLQKHLLGQVFDMTIDVPNILPIFAKVNFENRYANLESIVTFNLNSGTYTYDIAYPNNTIYGPNYNVLDFLSNLDPTLNASYELKNLTTFNAQLNGLSGPNELSISLNLISGGSNYISTLQQYLPGTWVDVTLGTLTVKRVRIDRAELTTFEDGVKRIILHTDTNLASRLDGGGIAVTIRPRTSLGEISKDLEFTDNINMPRPNTDGEYGTAGFVFSNESFGNYKYGYNNYVQTATSYAKWLGNDPKVKAVISAMIWLDESNDLRLNVYDWNTDPNFAFRPLDLYGVGIDFVLKNSITILDTNWNINDNIFGLSNVDFNKFNFQLTDQLTLTSLNQKYPWVLNADVRNAVIGEEDYSFNVTNEITGVTSTVTQKRLRWYTGQWNCGTWENGAWYSGSAYNILWLRGEWFSKKVEDIYNIWQIDFNTNNVTYSKWYSGIFGSGIWHNGTWYDGTFQSGTWENGQWNGGNWLNGTWQNGIFQGGIWHNGTWLNGIFNSNNLQSIWIDGTWLGGDFENGTWTNGIWDQGAGKKSRFGTKSTTVQPAIWLYGQWKNGEFHNFLNTDSNGNPIASLEYRASIWRNGIWEGGNWYGGTWERGFWKNGIWWFGLWRSLLQLDVVQRVTIQPVGQPSQISTWLKFSVPHLYNNTPNNLDFNNQTTLDNKLLNIVTIIGEPDVSSGNLPLLIKGDPTQEQQTGLGWNSFPAQHVVNIIDDYTLEIMYLPIGTNTYVGKNLVGDVYLDQGTAGTSGNDFGTSGTSGICIDRNLIIAPPPAEVLYEFVNVYKKGPFAVSNWQNGTFKSGIWEFGYWANGNWEGGLWLDGVFERGTFGV